MEATHITFNPWSGKLGTINEDDDDEEEEEEEERVDGSTIYRYDRG